MMWVKIREFTFTGGGRPVGDWKGISRTSNPLKSGCEIHIKFSDDGSVADSLMYWADGDVTHGGLQYLSDIMKVSVADLTTALHARWEAIQSGTTCASCGHKMQMGDACKVNDWHACPLAYTCAAFLRGGGK